MAFKPLSWYCQPVANGVWATTVQNALGAYTPCVMDSLVICLSHLIMMWLYLYQIWITQKNPKAQKYCLRSNYYNYVMALLVGCSAVEPLFSDNASTKGSTSRNAMERDNFLPQGQGVITTPDTNIQDITSDMMNRVKDRLKQKNINLQYTKEVVVLLGTLGFDLSYGARSVKRVIHQMVENEIAMGVLRGDFKDDDSVVVDVDTLSLAKDLPQNTLVIKKLESSSSEDVMVAKKKESGAKL